MTAAGFPRSFLDATTGSFLDFAQSAAPQVLPARERLAASAGEAPLGTTIVALTCADGVVMAGDRRATIGHQIASRRIEKVFPADRSSLIGIAGTAGLALELARLFQLELEHYEKIEGTELSLEGRANRLASMLRSQLGLALQGLAVVPLFAGVAEDGPRIYSFDVTGGRYSEVEHHSVGSGSGYARGALKKLWRPGLDRDRAVEVAVEALYDAADDDAATAGPDVGRDIFPTVFAVDDAGAQRIGEADVRAASRRVVETRAGGSRA